MKKFLLIAWVLFGLAVFASAQAQETPYQSAVLPAEYNMPGKTPWHPSSADIEKAEKLIYEYLASGQNKEAYRVQQYAPMILKEYQKYNRQYVGFIDENGDKNIWAVFSMIGFPQGQTTVIRVMDGGYHYFQIKVNLSKDKCYELQINGDA